MNDIKKLRNGIKRLATKDKRRVLRKATRRGTAIVQRKAKQLAPKVTRQGLKQIKIKNLRTANRAYEVGYTIIFDTPKKSKQVPYMYFQEVGTKNGIKPKMFVQNAFDITKKQAEEEILTQLEQFIEQELGKL